MVVINRLHCTMLDLWWSATTTVLTAGNIVMAWHPMTISLLMSMAWIARGVHSGSLLLILMHRGLWCSLWKLEAQRRQRLQENATMVACIPECISVVADTLQWSRGMRILLLLVIRVTCYWWNQIASGHGCCIHRQPPSRGCCCRLWCQEGAPLCSKSRVWWHFHYRLLQVRYTTWILHSRWGRDNYADGDSCHFVILGIDELKTHSHIYDI